MMHMVKHREPGIGFQSESVAESVPLICEQSNASATGSPNRDGTAVSMGVARPVPLETKRPKIKPIYTEIPRIDATGLSSDELKAKVLALPICFVSGLTQPMDASVFTRDHLRSHHGDVYIDSLRQNPDDFGFPISPNARVPDETVKSYLDYSESLEREVDDLAKQVMAQRVFDLMAGTKGNDCEISRMIGRRLGEPEANWVKFGVNVDVGEWPTVVCELNKLPSWCRWGEVDEVLHKLPHDMTIPGFSLPQMYFKVPGVYTGLHEENLRMHSINTNWGPGISVWGAIAPEHGRAFREAVLAKKKQDIYVVEGRCFPDLEFCAENDIPVMLGRQLPGDTAILNGATLHWVRSGGFAINSSWNFGVRTSKQFTQAITRDMLNFKLGIRSIIPIRCLALEILKDFRAKHAGGGEHMVSKSEFDFMQTVLQLINRQGGMEAKYSSDFRNENARSKIKICRLLEPDGSAVILCDHCWREIVHEYIVCDSCASFNVRHQLLTDANKSKPVFFCHPCGLAHRQHDKRHKLEARFKKIDEHSSDLAIWLATYNRWFISSIKY